MSTEKRDTKDFVIHTRLETNLRARFLACCAEVKLKPSVVIRKLVENFVKKQEDQDGKK